MLKFIWELIIQNADTIGTAIGTLIALLLKRGYDKKKIRETLSSLGVSEDVIKKSV